MNSLKKHGPKMVVAAGALVAAFAGASTLPGQSDKLICTGEERWEVKTMQDEDAGQIKFTPKRISFQEILDKSRADTWSTAKDDERQPDEFQVYTLRGKIPYVAKEADQDIHIEFVDVNNPDLHLVAEIPNPDCPITKNSLYKEKFRKVRNTFINKYQDKSVYTSGTFEITGVLFHDKKNHGRGGNKNGVEIHPILDIKKIK